MIVIASVLSLFGLGILRCSWGLQDRNSLMNLLGWGLIIGSLFVWKADGADRGIALGLCLFIVFALLFIFRESWVGGKALKRGQVRKPKTTIRKQAHPRIISLRGVGLFLVNGPILGFIAFASAMACYELMLMYGSHASDSLVLALFLFPLIWAALVAYFMIGTSRFGKAFTFIALPALSAIALVTGN